MVSIAIQRIRREDRESWLALRKRYIGGSDAASIVGLNDYQSPYALWCEKRGITPEFEGNLRTEVGAYLEDFIAKRFEQETGKRVQRSNFSFVNESYPWAIADVDREIVGENAGLECKSTSALNLKHYKNGDYPSRFYVQCVHYMAVKGYERMYLAVLIGNSDFKIFVIDRDEAEIEALMTAEKDFYGFMESGNPPPIDGSGSTREAIQAQQEGAPAEEPEPVDLSSSRRLLDTLMELESAIAQMEEQRSGIKNQLIQLIGSAWHGNCEGYSISYKPQTRNTFDWKKLQKAYPQIDLNPFFKSSTSRPLSIKRVEEQSS